MQFPGTQQAGSSSGDWRLRVKCRNDVTRWKSRWATFSVTPASSRPSVGSASAVSSRPSVRFRNDLDQGNRLVQRSRCRCSQQRWQLRRLCSSAKRVPVELVTGSCGPRMGTDIWFNGRVSMGTRWGQRRLRTCRRGLGSCARTRDVRGSRTRDPNWVVHSRPMCDKAAAVRRPEAHGISARLRQWLSSR